MLNPPESLSVPKAEAELNPVGYITGNIWLSIVVGFYVLDFRRDRLTVRMEGRVDQECRLRPMLPSQLEALLEENDNGHLFRRGYQVPGGTKGRFFSMNIFDEAIAVFPNGPSVTVKILTVGARTFAMVSVLHSTVRVSPTIEDFIYEVGA